MKSFQFNAIWMLAREARAARKVAFDPKKNLIVGRNHTGKSTIVKTLFVTMGATPQGKLSEWDQSTISLVSFSFDESEYYALHQSNVRALFSSNGTLIAATTNNKNWTSLLTRIFGFNLVLTNKDQQTAEAD